MDNKVKILIFIFITLLTISSLSHLTQNAFAESNYQDDEDVEATLHSTLVSDSSEIHSSLMPIGSYSFFETPELDVGSFSHDLTMIDVAKLQFPEFNATTSQSYSFVEGVNATQGNHTIYFNQELPEYTTSGGFDTIIYLNFNYSSSDYQIDTIFYDDFSSYGYWDLYNVSNRIFVSNDYPTGDAMVASNNPDHPYGGWYCLTVDSSGYWSYFSYVSDYLDANFSASLPNTKFYLTKESAPTGMTHSIYQTSKFYESNITWNNKPAVGDLISSEFISGGAGSKWLLDLETSIRYYYYVFKTTGGQLRWYAKDGNPANKKPLVHQYFYKNYQNDSLIYMQTNETETLSLVSPDYGDIELVNKDNITIQCQSTSDHQLNLELSNAGNVIKTLEVIPEGNTEFGNQTIQFMINESLIFDQLKFTGVFDNKEYFKCYDINITGYRRQNFEHVYAEEFLYTVLGITYNDTIELSFDEYKSDYYGVSNGTYFYYFDSSSLTHRQDTDDVIVNNQNLTIIIDLLETLSMTIDFTINVSYSTTSWRVPTEVSLTINSQSVIDLTYNSGYVYLSTFPTTLSITADSNVFFELNITCYFTFNFDLEIISKTYLRKTFKLLSDHSIYIDTISLDSDLDIKKIYLNNDDLGYSNPNHLIPPVQMDTDNIFNLEIILAEELYRNLPYDNSRELYDEDWSDWNLGYDSDDTISSFSNGNLSSQLQAGHYPATYGFKEDADGSVPSEWTKHNSITGSIVPILDGHRKVFQTTAGTTEYRGVYNDGIGQDTGIIEFWYRPSQTDKNINIYLLSTTTGNGGIYLVFTSSGTVQCKDGNTIKTLINPYTVKWYHIKIQYDQTTAGNRKFSIWIDNESKANNYDYWFDDFCDRIDFRVLSTGSVGYAFDAIGYSWDSNYKIGDNLFYENYMGTHDFENYDLSTYQNYFGTYDFEDYSLYDEVGNYTAEHGFDLETEAGYYKGSAGFNYEEVGVITSVDDNEWIDTLTLPNDCTCEITTEWQNHKNILNLTHDGGANDPVVRHNMVQATSGTFEFWIGQHDTSDEIRFSLTDGGDTCILLSFQSDAFYWRDYVGTWHLIQVVSDDTLYHIRVVWRDDTPNDKCDIYVDGIKKEDDIDMRMDMTGGIDSFILTYKLNVADFVYLDAPGLVGETDPEGYVYEPTWNINPFNIDKLLDEEYELDCAFGDSHIKITDSVDGHNNVLEMYDNQNNIDYGDSIDVNIPFDSNQEYGTIEFWMRSTNTANKHRIYLYDGTFIVFYFRIALDKFQYYDGTTKDVGLGATDNTWYHIRIAFECTDGGYEGLARFDWKVWINGTEYGDYDFASNRSHGDKFRIYTDPAENNFINYIDALTFSWSPNYIPYGNSNPYGQLVELEDDGWNINYAPYTSISNIYENSAHNKILNMTDNSASGRPEIKTYFSQTSGTIEFWVKTDFTDKTFDIGIQDGVYSDAIFIRFSDDGNLKYYDDSYHTILAYSSDQWYHFRIEFDCTDDWHLWINGTSMDGGTGYNFRGTPAEMDILIFSTHTGTTGDYSTYLNGISFSWDSDYSVGQNTNPYYEDLRDTGFFDDWNEFYGFNCWVNISGEYGQHKKYVEIYDNSAVDVIGLTKTFSGQNSGTIEFYLKGNDVTDYIVFRFRDSTDNNAFQFAIEDDNFKYLNSSGWQTITGISPSNSIWYRIKISFDCDLDVFSIYIDEITIIENTAFKNPITTFTKIFITTLDVDSDYSYYFDSFSFSWEDPIGINLLKEVSEIDNPYTTINKTISSADLELYSYTVIISFTYKFTQYRAYLNTTKMNDIELIDDNAYHIYSTTITTSQHSFFYTFNISNGILLLSDFNFVIENQHSIQKTINPITTIDSVEFKEYLQADRTFEYWYYRNIYTINSLEIEHDPSSTITSSFGYENHKYYFSQYANTDDEFTGTIDYNPNWQISFTFIVNNATYSKVKVDYGADFVIYNTTLVLDLRNSGIFDDIENPNRDNYVLNIDSLSFSSTTQSLYIIGNRTQQTPNPQTDVDLVQLNEEFTYNSQVLSSSYVSVNPNWQISTSVIDKNGTYGKLEIDYKADLPLINVDLKTLVKRNNMFSDVVETKDYQNDTSIYFQLDGLSFTTDYQSTYVEGFRTLLELDITTDDIYLDYNEEYKWSSTSLSNYTVGLCPCWLVSISVLENNGTYGKVQVDFKADLSLINVDLKFSILRNVIFGDSIEIKGYQNTTEINFILENINFTTSLQSEVVEGFRTLLESDITTDDIYLDYNEEYKWSSISLSNYSIEIKPNWDVSFSYVYNNASYSYIQSDYSSDLDFYNVTMNLDLRNTAIFDDMDNQGKDDYLLTIEYLNFTTSTKTLYITGTRTQYTSNPQTDINIIQLNETITYNNDVLTTSLVDNDPNWQISISVIQKNATYGKLEIEYKSDATYTNVDLKTSITRNNMFDDSVEVKGYQNETTLSFELSVITFNSSFQITYIEGFRYLDEIDIHTNMSYVDYEERYYWSSVSLNNYSIEINPNWVILSSIVEYNGTYSKIKIQCKSDIAINNVTLQFSRSRNSIFGDIYELAGYQNITKIEFNLQNVNFTSLYQTTYIECFRSLTQINPNTNMTYLDFEEQYYWNSTSLSNHSIRINPNWNVGYSIISNNGTFAQLNISYYSDLFISDILLKLSLRYDDLYAENWSNNAQQSIYTYILEIPDINFTTSEQILNLTGVSSVPYCNFSSFINEDGFKLSDEEWRIKITDEEWRTITKSNWEDIEVYMYGYVQFTKYSRVFIISDMEDDWELDGVHYQGIPYDISATGYFTCEGWGSGITSAYLRFKTNPIEDLRREQTREQVIYKIKSKYDLEDVDFIFYIEEDERYNINDMIKQLKKEIDCTDIIKYYSVEDRDYYMIMDMDLDEGTNKITIYYKIENAAKYSWAFLIVGIAMIGFSIIYISYRYYDNKILDFIGLDKLVKYFFWIKKSERIKMTKKYRLNKKKKKRGKK